MSKIDTDDNDRLLDASHGRKSDLDRINALEAALREIAQTPTGDNIDMGDGAVRAGLIWRARKALAGEA